MKADRIKTLRAELGQTQAEFAQAIGVTLTTVSQWENGRATPAPAQVGRLEAISRPSGGATAQAQGFRPIQYLGSKKRLCEPIVDLVHELSGTGDVVGDLFSGSGVVSSALASTRPVVAVDVQRYASVLAQAILTGAVADLDALATSSFWSAYEEARERLDKVFEPLLALDAHAIRAAGSGDGRPLDALIEWGSLAARHQLPRADAPPAFSRAAEASLKALRSSRLHRSAATATIYYGGVYFSFRQAIDLDALHAAAASTCAVLGQAVMLSVASAIVNSVGKQFAQPMRLIKADGKAQPLLLGRAVRDRRLDAAEQWREWSQRWRSELDRQRKPGHAVCSDVLTFVRQDRECAIYYADPPYTIDHYSRFYHVLETLISRDEPRLDTMSKAGRNVVMRGLYRRGRHQSAFSVPSTAEAAFDGLFSAAAAGGRTLVLSYSPYESGAGHRPRLLGLERLVSLAGKHFRRVNAAPARPHTHRKLNARELNVEALGSAESFIICED